MSKITIQNLIEKKQGQEKIVMLTAYDYPFAVCLDDADVDIILVGDSLANVVLGLESTRDVTLEMMIHHTKAVCRGVENALVMGDMPWESFQHGVQKAVDDARRYQQETGLDAVKVEWSDGVLDVIQAIRQTGIEVMGHVGLTPQTAEQYKVQGKDAESAKMIWRQAQQMEDCGCCGVVLECIPTVLAGKISNQLKIPTIGIGAGSLCDGQVLVLHDVLGLYDRRQPKFIKQFADAGSMIRTAAKQYAREVREGRFPSEEHGYHMKAEEANQLDAL